MGAYGSERTTQSLQDFPVVDSEEEAEEVTRSQGSRAGGVCAVSHRRSLTRSLIQSVGLQMSVAHVTCHAVLEAGGSSTRNGLEPGAQTQSTSSCGVVAESGRC